MKDTTAKQISEVAGCLVSKERQFLLDYATQQYTGQGEIVDLGCFLGSSSYALALGLENNDRVAQKDNRVHAYDRFEWNPWMDRPAARFQLARSYSKNECFVDEFERQMGDKTKYIRTVKCDLIKSKWESENSIEYLFVDSMKDWILCNSIIEGFYSAMIPGVSLLHHQDYVFFGTHWIHLTMYRMRDHFESIDHEYMGPSKVFRYTKQLPAELIRSYSIADFSIQEINDAFDYSLEIVRPAGRPEVVGSKIHALYEKRLIDEADRLLNDTKTKYPALAQNPVFQNSIAYHAKVARAA